MSPQGLSPRYRLTKVLGEGGDGRVYLAHTDDDKQYAVKLFHSGHDQEYALSRLRGWINLGQHPHVVRAYACGIHQGRIALVMEYVGGETSDARPTLLDWIARARRTFDPMNVIPWAIQVCLAMEHAARHGMAVHGDIKPSNILIAGGETVKVGDFSARWGGRTWSPSVRPPHASDDRYALAEGGRSIRGTLGYISPERYRGTIANDARSDVFSFGIVLWQMVTGDVTPPFMGREGASATSKADSIYESHMRDMFPVPGCLLDPVIRGCVAPVPAARLADFASVRRQLERLACSGRRSQ